MDLSGVTEFLNLTWAWLVSFFSGLIPNYILPNLQIILQVLILLVVAYVSGRVGKALTVKLLSVAGLKKITIRSWTDEILKAVGYRGTIVSLIGDLVKWFIYILVLSTIIQTLGLPGLVNIFNQITGFVPRFIVAILIVVVGFLIADFLGKIFEEAGKRFLADETLGVFSGGLIKYSVALVSVIMSLAMIGLDTTALSIMFAILLGGIVVILILGIKDMLPGVTSGIHLKRNLKVGEHIKVGNYSGIVEKIGSFSVTLRNKDRRYTVPNTMLLNNVVERFPKGKS
jgi:small-conductance mechanosensitive channel